MEEIIIEETLENGDVRYSLNKEKLEWKLKEIKYNADCGNPISFSYFEGGILGEYLLEDKKYQHLGIEILKASGYSKRRIKNLIKELKNEINNSK